MTPSVWRMLLTMPALFLMTGVGHAGQARVAIKGYDTVAYFTDNKPVPGDARFAYVWHDARWQFSSAAHRKLFVGDPDRYAPQYGGYCAMGMSLNKIAHKDVPDPEAWAIVDGKLYLTHSKAAMEKWQKSRAKNIARADANWPRVKEQKAVYDGYPHKLE